MAVALTVFALVYFPFMFTTLSVGELGLFLFAMFQLALLAGKLNKYVHRTESYLSDLVRTQRFVNELEAQEEAPSGDEPGPEPVEEVAFEDVWFSYNQSEKDVIRGDSFEARTDEFIGFVGHSGAGKSTIVSLLSDLYEPDQGAIRANGQTFARMDVDSWRDRVAIRTDGSVT